jgi:hypothetical protein
LGPCVATLHSKSVLRLTSARAVPFKATCFRACRSSSISHYPVEVKSTNLWSTLWMFVYFGFDDDASQLHCFPALLLFGYYLLHFCHVLHAHKVANRLIHGTYLRLRDLVSPKTPPHCLFLRPAHLDFTLRNFLITSTYTRNLPFCTWHTTQKWSVGPLRATWTGSTRIMVPSIQQVPSHMLLGRAIYKVVRAGPLSSESYLKRCLHVHT